MKTKKKLHLHLNLKKGHRENAAQHEQSDGENLRLLKGYRKADNRSGGHGGGKKGRPLEGWEKGDIMRDKNLASSPIPLTVKSIKRLRAK